MRRAPPRACAAISRPDELQGERILRDMDVVQREEFEAVKEMAVKAREENERLAVRVAALEAEVAALKRPA